jgi:hypothetical protein
VLVLEKENGAAGEAPKCEAQTMGIPWILPNMPQTCLTVESGVLLNFRKWPMANAAPFDPLTFGHPLPVTSLHDHWLMR